ncbi:polyphosphate kinase 2 family protein [Kaistella sp.]|uniref:polyphosphate kinase 2 family protein n=1 Tax=Kaistella sp. TaxID=2782235 RepID=UPI0035A0FFF3
MDLDFTDNFMVEGKFSMKDFSTEYEGKLSKADGKKMLAKEQEKLRELQERLYSDGSKSILIVLQAMDAAGKDSLIKHVFGGVNPQGCTVTSFKTPNDKEYAHDFLWRHYLALPEKGKIGIFNRSHYESVLVCKVHPEYNLSEKVWKDVDDFDNEFWENRYESIRNFEKHLAENGTTIIKIFLNVSQKEQKERFLDRINEEDKNWKFSSADLAERALWPDYMNAYEEAINETSKDYAPWFVIPADNKWFTRVAAIQIIIDAMEKMDLKYPELSEKETLALEDAKKELESE